MPSSEKVFSDIELHTVQLARDSKHRNKATRINVANYSYSTDSVLRWLNPFSVYAIHNLKPQFSTLFY